MLTLNAKCLENKQKTNKMVFVRVLRHKIDVKICFVAIVETATMTPRLAMCTVFVSKASSACTWNCFNGSNKINMNSVSWSRFIPNCLNIYFVGYQLDQTAVTKRRAETFSSVPNPNRIHKLLRLAVLRDAPMPLFHWRPKCALFLTVSNTPFALCLPSSTQTVYQWEEKKSAWNDWQSDKANKNKLDEFGLALDWMSRWRLESQMKATNMPTFGIFFFFDFLRWCESKLSSFFSLSLSSVP